MNAIFDQHSVRLNPATIAPVLRTIALCDLVESTALIQQLGDKSAAEFFRRHDRLCRDMVQKYDGLEIDKTDGFLLLFDRPIQAVAFALDYQRQLREMGETEFLPLRARIGIHVGDVMLWENNAADIAQGAKPIELEGLVKPIAARLMNLALPGQTLLSGIAYVLAQRAQIELDREHPLPQWRAHGSFRFKGVDEPVPVFEVGESGVAPLRAPSYSGKAHREIPWWRRPGTLIAEAALLALAVIVPVYFSLRSPPAIAFAKRDWIVVGDFKNLTGESVFDDSLQTAFRIGLEQSRFVNVLSDLKVRDTIKLMQRDPEHTRVDRGTGSEVAIREGARALVLPTIAEIGGRVRVTAEVIDPKTQATVYSESADGLGAASVLPSLDKVNQQLRVRLGEALATVSTESQPLEKVATRNLDALRAFSLGERAYDSGDMKSALAFYQQALKLDPGFAPAHIQVAQVFNNANQYAEAAAEIESAGALRDRLAPRDALYVDAWKATFASPDGALEKWKMLSSLYPDFFAAQGLYAFFAWQTNRYDAAIEANTAAISPRNAHRIINQYLLGILFLARDRLTEAGEQFTIAESGGLTRPEYHASFFASQRQFDKAGAVYARGKAAGIAADDIDAYIPRVAFALDQGQWELASTTLHSAQAGAAAMSETLKLWLTGIDLGLRSLRAPLPDQALGDYVADEINMRNRAGSGIERIDAQVHIVFAAYLAAHQGNVKLAQSALSNAQAGTSTAAPLLNLIAIAGAEIDRVSGHPEQAVSKLEALVDNDELLLTHVALLDAYASAQKSDAAVAQAQWLNAHRGLAYGEYAAHQFLTVYNVGQTDLAQLRAAELIADSGHQADANRQLDIFRKAWPQAEQLDFIAPRLRKLAQAP